MNATSSRPFATASFGGLLVDLATWVLAACVLWAAFIAVAAVVEAASAGRVRALSWVAAPPGVRRVVLAALGVALAGGLPGPVSAGVLAASVGGSPRPGPLAGTTPRPLPVPARPIDTPAGGGDTAVVVRRGDTLWALAARELGGSASDRQVLTSVRRWHALNRAVIGPDPGLIRPGQRLTRPPHEEKP